MLRSYTTAFRRYVNHLRLPWRKTQRENLIRLGGAFLVRRHLALRRLARTLAGPTPQAKAQDKRLRRFLGNDRLHLDDALRAYLCFLLPRLGRVPYVPVMLDWTYVAERAILTLAIPYRGRSLPLFATVHERRIERRVYSQTQAEIALLRRVRWCWPADAPPPLLLVDRGFDKSRLLEWLLHGTTGKKKEERAPGAPGSPPWRFVLRSCMQAAVTDRQGRRLTKRLTAYPGETLLYPHVTYHLEGQLATHLVVTCVEEPKTQARATWYLLTNLPEAQLRYVPAWYAERMEPEETYRDWKDGFLLSGFGLRGLKRLRRDRLERYLFLLGLIYGFLVFMAETQPESRAWFQRRKGWGVSLITFALELLTHLGERLCSLARQACASVHLQPLWPQSGDY